MIRTRICDLLGIPHPIVLGGMGNATTAPLVAAVSNAGGFGTLGTSAFDASTLDREIASIHERTEKPFGINHLLFQIQENMFAVTLAARPTLIAFAWARKDQNLRDYVQRAHDAGCKVMYLAGEVAEALRAAEAGADVLVAQGTEAGGHVGWMASLPLVPMMVKALAPLPVLCAGGIADGRGLAGALALGAEGVLLGTRFLATHESPLHANFKQAIVDSDGHDTVLTRSPISPANASGPAPCHARSARSLSNAGPDGSGPSVKTQPKSAKSWPKRAPPAISTTPRSLTAKTRA